MDFDKDEDKLNLLYNLYKLRDKKIRWNEEELNVNLERIKIMQTKICELEVRLFFSYIDRYLDCISFDDLDADLEAEFQELNHG